ncbi:MAG: hypothetical protein WCH84_07095 [Verrucomicrobiota bacterium]
MRNNVQCEIVLKKFATKKENQNHVICAGVWVSSVICLVPLIAAPQIAPVANFLQATTAITTNASLTNQFNNLDSNTFNYGLAHTLTYLATSKSQGQSWLILANTAGTDASLTRTPSVPGSGGKHRQSLPVMNSREQAEIGVT